MGNQPSKQDAMGNNSSRQAAPTHNPAPQPHRHMATDDNRVAFVTNEELLSQERSIQDRRHNAIRGGSARNEKKNKSNIHEGQDNPRRSRTPYPRTSPLRRGEPSRRHNERQENESNQNISYHELRDFYEYSMEWDGSGEAGTRDNPISLSDEAQPEHQNPSSQELRAFDERSRDYRLGGSGSRANPIILSDDADHPESPASHYLPNNNGIQRERTQESPSVLAQHARYAGTGNSYGLETNTENECEQRRSFSRTLSASSSDYYEEEAPAGSRWSLPARVVNGMQAPAPVRTFSRVHEAQLLDSQRPLPSPSPIWAVAPASPSDSQRELLSPSPISSPSERYRELSSPTPLPPPTPRLGFSRVMVDRERRELRSQTPQAARPRSTWGGPPTLPPLPPIDNRRRFASPSPMPPLPPASLRDGMYLTNPLFLASLAPGMHLQPSSLLGPVVPGNYHVGTHFPMLAPLPPETPHDATRLPYLAPLPPYSDLITKFQDSPQIQRAPRVFEEEDLYGDDEMADEHSWNPYPAQSVPERVPYYDPYGLYEDDSMPLVEAASPMKSELRPYEDYAPSRAPQQAHEEMWENKSMASLESVSDLDSEDSFCSFCDGDVHQQEGYEPEWEGRSPTPLSPERPRYRY